MEHGMIPLKFYNEIAKEFGVEIEHLKMVELVLCPGHAPNFKLTVELNAQQTNALHWINEQEVSDAQASKQVPHAEQT
jgi:hypothetical protein